MSAAIKSDTGPVIVALSGGVDSSVAALLLKQAGHPVQGLHMTNWDDEDGYCTAAEDLQDARKVCDVLDIPLHRANFAAEYRARVFRHFLRDYEAGRTPNPDVLCNREIKFGVFHDHARRLGAARIATGHYARTIGTEGTTTLAMGVDHDKDQTYFLHAVSQQALHDSVFPLGELTKREVRAIASRHGLPTRNKKDSTGICFIGERPFRAFLGRYLPASPGAMLTPEGREVGEHHGSMFYTIGQRKGLGIGGVAGAAEAPWYVAARDIERNTLTVVQGENHPLLWSRELIADDPHWIAGAAPAALAEPATGHLVVALRIRHRQQPQRGRVSRLGNGRLHVVFDRPQWAVAPGQYAVFYDADICLGGARIRSAGAGVSTARLAS